MSRKRPFLTTHHYVEIGKLVGAGCSMAEILEHLEITDARAVYEILKQFNLELQTGPAGTRIIPIRVDSETYERFRQAAAARDIVGMDKPRKMIQRVVSLVGAKSDMIDAVADDGIKTGARR